MADDLLDVKIFEIVYNKHPNEPMSFIQEEALKMQIAIHKNKLYLKQCLDQGTQTQSLQGFTQMPAVQKTEKPAISSANIKDVSTWRISDPEGMRNSIGEDEIKCCICHNSSQHFKSLNRHLRKHGITPEEYKSLCGIDKNTPLMAKKVYNAAAERMRNTATMARQPGEAAPQGGDLNAPQGGDLNAQQGGNLNAPQDGNLNAPQGGDLNAPQGGDLNAPQGGDLNAQQGGDLNAQQGGDLNAPQGGDLNAQQGGNLNATQDGNLFAPQGGDLNAQQGGNLNALQDGNLFAPQGDNLNVQQSADPNAQQSGGKDSPDINPPLPSSNIFTEPPHSAG